MIGDAETLDPKIWAPEAPDFQVHIPELLKKGGIKDTTAARYRLDSELNLAWTEADLKRELQQNPPAADLFEQLTNSIKKTQGLLRRLERFSQWHNVGFDLCPIGEGTVSIQDVQTWISGGTLGLPRNPPPLGSLPEQAAPGGTVAIINRQRVLDRLQREIAHGKPNRKRGNQKELDKSLIVARAVSFFRQYSSVKPTTYPYGPCVKFCGRFYEVVTGETIGPSGLLKQIRRELAKTENPNMKEI